MLSYLSYSKRRGSKWKKSAMHVGFWKLCMTVVHVDVTFKGLFRKYVTAVIDGHFALKGITQNRKTFRTQPKRLRF